MYKNWQSNNRRQTYDYTLSDWCKRIYLSNSQSSGKQRKTEKIQMKQQRLIASNCDYCTVCYPGRQISSESSLSDWSDPLDLLRPLNRWEGCTVSRRCDSLKNIYKYFSHQFTLNILFSLTPSFLSTTDLLFLPDRPAPCSEGPESGALALS